MRRRLMMQNCEESYIKDGLILWLDGIKNTRNGHSTDLITWEDLSGNNNDCVLNGTGFEIGTDYIFFDNSHSGVIPGFKPSFVQITLSAIINPSISTQSIRTIAGCSYYGDGNRFDMGIPSNWGSFRYRMQSSANANVLAPIEFKKNIII